MSNQLLNEKIAPFRLNSALLQKLVTELDEQTQEVLSGGARDRFYPSKPHVNVGS